MTGQDLKELISDNGVTAYKLADIIGVTHVTIYNLFKHDHIPPVYELAVNQVILYKEYYLDGTL